MKKKKLTIEDLFDIESMNRNAKILMDWHREQNTIDIPYEDVTDQNKIESPGIKAIECKAQEAE